jgi:hypothetical protein
VLLGALLLLLVEVEVLLLLLRWPRCFLGLQRLPLAAAAGRSMGSGCCLRWRVLRCLMVSSEAFMQVYLQGSHRMLTRPPSGCLVLYVVCGCPMPRAVVH